MFFIKTLRKQISVDEHDFELLVPMRNEVTNVAPLLASLLRQGGKVVALDDNSTDSTLVELQKFSEDIQILVGKELPDGWLGKNFACHQLAINSRSEFLVFVDADVRLEVGAVNSAIKFMKSRGWSFISPYPRQKTSGLLQVFIQPLLQWSWFATIPFFIAYRFPNKSMAVANGQFLIITRAAYLASGGHKMIKDQVLDDIELARLLIKSGYRGGPVDGSRIANCHMYKSDREMIAGYSKSLWRAFGSKFGSLIALSFLLLNAWPFLHITYGILFLLISRALVAIKVRSNLLSALFHPISMFALGLLVLYSNYLNMMGRLTWKGRTL
jgi:glycosyltransferase involved in cell wall biosynthesis